MSPEHEAELVTLKLADPDAWTLVELAKGYLAVRLPDHISNELVSDAVSLLDVEPL